MYGSSETPRHLSMHAELTISNNAHADGNALPATHSEQDGSIVRMIYTWTTNSSQEPHLNSSRNVPANNQPEQDARSNASYGFQRGNMVFTSTPPHRDINFNQNSFYSQNNPPRRPMPYERRCRSTCSIILSTDIGADETIIQNPPQAQPFHQQCPRTRPRCQSANLNEDDPCCGESFCHHTHEETRQSSPLFFSCEECKTNQSIPKNATNTFTTHFCTKVSEKKRTSTPYFKTKDMTTQTVETREKSTSPLEKMHELNKENKSDSELSKAKRKPQRKTSLRKEKTPRSSRRNSVTRANKKDSTASSDRSHKTNTHRTISRSPEMIFDNMKKAKQNFMQDSLKQRTVHIDVYCTASEESESDSSSTIFTSDDDVSLCTVFKTDKEKITHRRAGSSELPYSLKRFAEENIPSEFPIEDDCSTAYPSALSSFSTIRNYGTSSSICPSSALSSSCCTFPEYSNSTTDMSCKESATDMESYFQKKMRVRPTESDYFIPRRLETSGSADNLKKNNSNTSILPYSDSFEYMDSSDRERIQRMERQWNEQQKCWKSPQVERKHILQQQKIQEYINKRLHAKGKTSKTVEESDSECSDKTEEELPILREEEEKNKDVTLKRGSTVYKAKVITDDTLDVTQKTEDVIPIETKNKQRNLVKSDACTNTVFSKPSVDKCSFKKPFTNFAGICTDPLGKAQKFGTVISTIRKPGRHIGPAKNPDCLCEHCKTYYNNSNHGRARSLSNPPYNETEIWKNILKPYPPKKVSNYSDF